MSDSLDERLARWLRPEVRALKAYHVPDARGLIKLDAMENPYGLPPDLRDAWLACLRDVAVNRYPDPQAQALRARLRQHLALGDEHDLLFGNGSDELIQMLITAFAGSDRVALAPVPTFVMYDMLARIVGMQFVGVNLRADFSLDLPAMLQTIQRAQPALIFLAYPNNPTGNAFAFDELEALVRVSPGLVVIDEAYRAFAERDATDLLARYPQVVIMRTFSKEGLAGLRLGYLIGRPAVLRELDKIRLPYNINVLTQASALFALEHASAFAQQAQAIRRERARVLTALQTIHGVQPYPSETNFILFRIDAATGMSATAIHAELRTQGVLIKNLDGAHAALANCLRVTVGTSDENAAFLVALQRALKQPISSVR